MTHGVLLDPVAEPQAAAAERSASEPHHLVHKAAEELDSCAHKGQSGAGLVTPAQAIATYPSELPQSK